MREFCVVAVIERNRESRVVGIGGLRLAVLCGEGVAK